MNNNKRFDSVSNSSPRTSGRRSASKSNDKVQFTKHANQRLNKDNDRVSEIFYPDFLHHIVRNDSFIEQLTVTSNSLCTLEEITEPDTFELEFELMRIDIYLEKDVAILKVKDGTICPSSLMCFPTSSSWKELEQRMKENPVYRSQEPIVDLLLLNSSLILLNLKELSYYTMKNVRVVRATEKRSLVMCANGKNAYLIRKTQLDHILRRINSKKFQELENKYLQSTYGIDEHKNKTKNSPSLESGEKTIVKENEFSHRKNDVKEVDKLTKPKLEETNDEEDKNILCKKEKLLLNSLTLKKQKMFVKQTYKVDSKTSEQKSLEKGSNNITGLSFNSESESDCEKDKNKKICEGNKSRDIQDNQLTPKTKRKVSSDVLINNKANINGAGVSERDIHITKKNLQSAFNKNRKGLQKEMKGTKKYLSESKQKNIRGEGNKSKIKKAGGFVKSFTLAPQNRNKIISLRNLKRFVGDRNKRLQGNKGIKNNTYVSEDRNVKGNDKPKKKNINAEDENKKKKCMLKSEKQLNVKSQSQSEDSSDEDIVESKSIKATQIVKANTSVTSKKSERLSPRLLKNTIENNKNKKCTQNHAKKIRRNILSESEHENGSEESNIKKLNIDKSKTSEISDKMLLRKQRSMIDANKKKKFLKKDVELLKRNISSESEQESSNEENRDGSKIKRPNNIFKGKRSKISDKILPGKLKDTIESNKNNKCSDNYIKQLKRNISSDSEEEASNNKACKIKKANDIVEAKTSLTLKINKKISQKNLKNTEDGITKRKCFRNDLKQLEISVSSESKKENSSGEDCEETGKTFDNSIKDKSPISLGANKTKMSPRNLRTNLGFDKNVKILQSANKTLKRNNLSESEEEERCEGSIEMNDFLESKLSPKQKTNEKHSRKLRSDMKGNKNKKFIYKSFKKVKRSISLESGDTIDENSKESKTGKVKVIVKGETPMQEMVTPKKNEVPSGNLRIVPKNNRVKEKKINDTKKKERYVRSGSEENSSEEEDENSSDKEYENSSNKEYENSSDKEYENSSDEENENSSDEEDKNSENKKTDVFFAGKSSIKFNKGKKMVPKNQPNVVDEKKEKSDCEVSEKSKKNISTESDKEDCSYKSDKKSKTKKDNETSTNNISITLKTNEEKMSSRSNVDVKKSEPKIKDTISEVSKGGKTNVILERKPAIKKIKYKRLSELRENEICVNVFGIIKNIMLEEGESKIIKYRVAVEIIDHSQDDPFSVHFFFLQNHLLSLSEHMKTNQIIELIGMKVGKFNGPISGRVFTEISVELYDSDTGRNILWRKAPRLYEISDTMTEIIKSLASWNKEKTAVQSLDTDIQEEGKTFVTSDSIAKENLAEKNLSKKLQTDSPEKQLKIESKTYEHRNPLLQNQTKSDLYSILNGIVLKKEIDIVRNEKVNKMSLLHDFKDITDSEKFNMIFQIVNVHHYNEINLDIIQVRDGTLCPIPMLNIPLKNDWCSVKNSILKSPAFTKNSSTLDIICFESRPILPPLKVGKCYLFRALLVIKTRLSVSSKEKDGYLICVESKDCEPRETNRYLKARELLRNQNEVSHTNVNPKVTDMLKSLLPSSEDSVDRAMCDLSLPNAQHDIKEMQKDNILKKTTDLTYPDSKTPSLIDLDHTDGINTDIPPSVAREIDSIMQEESAVGLPVTLSEDMHLRNTGSDPSYSQFVNHINKRSEIFKTSTQTCEAIKLVCTLSSNNSNKTNENTKIENSDSVAVNENYLVLSPDCTKLSDVRSGNKDGHNFDRKSSNSSRNDLEEDLHSDADSESILNRCHNKHLKDFNLTDKSVISGVFEKSKNVEKGNIQFEKEIFRSKESQEVEMENVSSCESSGSDIEVIEVNTPKKGINEASNSKNYSLKKNFQKSFDAVKSPSKNRKLLIDCFKDPNFKLPSHCIYKSKNNTEESSHMDQPEEDGELDSIDNYYITSVTDFPDLPLISSNTFLELKATNCHSYTVIPVKLLTEMDDEWEEKCVHCVCNNCNNTFVLSDLEKVSSDKNDSWPDGNVPVCPTRKCNKRHIRFDNAHFQFEMELNLVKFKLILQALLESYSAETFLGCSLLEFLRSATKRSESKSRLNHLFCQNETNCSQNIYHITLWRKNMFDPNSGPLYIKHIELA